MRNLLFGTLFFLSACGNNTADTNPAIAQAGSADTNAELLFKVNCSQCHQPAKNFVGPALAGAEKRWKNKELLYDFVRNSTEVIQRDKYAAELYEKWNESPMLTFPQLSDQEIQAILDYCNTAAAQQ